MEQSRVMLLQPSPAAVQSQRQGKALTSVQAQSLACAAGTCHNVKQNSTTRFSNTFHRDLRLSVAQPHPSRVVCTGNSWQASSRAHC